MILLMQLFFFLLVLMPFLGLDFFLCLIFMLFFSSQKSWDGRSDRQATVRKSLSELFIGCFQTVKNDQPITSNAVLHH